MSHADDQQPIRAVIGHRTHRAGLPPDSATRAAQAKMAQYRTQAPKGVFKYDSHEQMAADRLRWTVAAVVARARAR